MDTGFDSTFPYSKLKFGHFPCHVEVLCLSSVSDNTELNLHNLEHLFTKLMHDSSKRLGIQPYFGLI